MASSSSITRCAFTRSPSTKASVPAPTAFVASDARRTTSRGRSRSRAASGVVVCTCPSSTARDGARRRCSHCLLVVHLRATTRPQPRYEPSLRSAPDDPFTGGTTLMRRSITRACGFFLAAFALPVLAVGSATAATKAPTTTTLKLQSTSLSGDGSTFQKGFNDVAIGYFKQLQKGVSISYQGVGSGQGRTDFSNKVVDFAGTDAPYAAGAAPADPFLYFPTVVAPITVSYNVSGLAGLKLSADTIAKIFSA